MRFSFTLFRYVFVDLLRVFMMAVGALSGILSFGGMLRPLMQQGLDAGQVGAMLAYFGPAMTAYALPIGALFATTVVYGRLSADNEVVACRAGGLSHLSIAAPAFVLGLLVSMLALGLLLFVVPLYTLKVEQVVTSNIAQLIASRINRSHSIRFGAATVFANQAYVPAADPNNPRVQTVVLESPTIVTYVDRTLGLIVRADSKATAEAMQKLLSESMARNEIKGKVLSIEVGPVTAADVERAAAINGSEPERLAEQRAAARAASRRDKPADPDARRAREQAASGAAGDPAADVTEAIVIAVKAPVEAGAKRLAEAHRVDVRDYKSDAVATADLKRERRFKVPRDFHLAKQATVRIYPDADNEQMLLAIGLEQGSKFPREFVGAQQAGVERAQFGPMPIPSPIKENTKFMDIWQLQRLFRNGDESRRIRGIVEDYVHRDQMFAYLHHLRDDLNDADGRTVLHGDQTYLLERQGGATSYEKLGELIVSNNDPKDPAKRVRFRITGDRRGPTTTATTNPATTSTSPDDDVVLAAREARLTARTGGDQAEVDIEFYDVEMLSRDGATPRRSARYGLSAPLPPDVAEMEHRTFRDYGPGGKAAAANPAAHQRLFRELTVLSNDIQSETWSRISFSISCLVLVLVGTALGMMFKSGNFLSAFAVSFIPALLSITLIIAGQRVCGSVPFDYPKHPNPLQLGLSLIWTGNAVNFLLACGLWWRLQRQ